MAWGEGLRGATWRPGDLAQVRLSLLALVNVNVNDETTGEDRGHRRPLNGLRTDVMLLDEAAEQQLWAGVLNRYLS
ncbi:hypothetical protein [Streptomyces griseoviridis]|uniref:hypothetical protein n=1 Tax=Streptomyces griseoviridis TaxID=45398 RepID=UPI003418EA1E